jgi:hypothetical protein
MKVKEFKNGAYTIFEKYDYWYFVRVYDSCGNLLDKMRCDDYRMARDYLRVFNAIAKNSK